MEVTADEAPPPNCAAAGAVAFATLRDRAGRRRPSGCLERDDGKNGANAAVGQSVSRSVRGSCIAGLAKLY